MKELSMFEEAICFAVEAHCGQVRKGETVPYIVHPMEVAAICATITADPEVLAAAVLHDTVEDTDTTPEEIERRFGRRVAALVASETEDKRVDLPPDETWRIRKEESLEDLKNATDPGVKILWLGDKLANIRSFRRRQTRCGDELWEIFNQKNPGQQAWYYRNIVGLLRELENTDAWRELNDDVEYLFKGV